MVRQFAGIEKCDKRATLLTEGELSKPEHFLLKFQITANYSLLNSLRGSGNGTPCPHLIPKPVKWKNKFE